MASSTPLRRGELNRERILDAALRVADRDGPEALSMRRIAEEIGASPMGLYRHFDSRWELVEGLIEHGFEATTLEARADLPWDEQLRTLFVGVHAALLEHPGLIALLATQPTSGVRALRAIEPVLENLRAAGFGADEAIAVLASLQSYTFGSTVRQRARAEIADEQARASLQGWASEQQFETGLDWLLEGIRAGRGR